MHPGELPQPAEADSVDQVLLLHGEKNHPGLKVSLRAGGLTWLQSEPKRTGEALTRAKALKKANASTI